MSMLIVGKVNHFQFHGQIDKKGEQRSMSVEALSLLAASDLPQLILVTRIYPTP